MSTILVTALLLVLQGDKPDGWMVVNAANKGYTVTMPKPERKAFQEQGPDNKLVHISVSKATAEKRVYTVSVYEYSSTFMEQPASAILDHVRTKTVFSLSGRMVTEKDIKYDQVPGREVIVDGKRSGYLRARLYVFNQRVYLVSVLAETESDLMSEDAQRFFTSFKLKPVKPATRK
ncbi:MAG TPA: hypothetical protein PLX97_04760 [Gemmatales bacterium]|nr:hypothetical protein [Gemmatales bacterium]